MKKWAFIYTSGDVAAPPIAAATGSDACVLLTVGVPSAAEVPDEVVSDLISQDVELIELCGAFGPAEAAKVIEQVGGRVPVGYVTYPCSEAGGLHSLFG